MDGYLSMEWLMLGVAYAAVLLSVVGALGALFWVVFFAMNRNPFGVRGGPSGLPQGGPQVRPRPGGDVESRHPEG